MDANGNGHPTQGGIYHNHVNPIALYSDPSTGHSPLIGFALDGYPIYGPFGYDSPMDSTSAIARMESSYQLAVRRSCHMADRPWPFSSSPTAPTPMPSDLRNDSWPIRPFVEQARPCSWHQRRTPIGRSSTKSTPPNRCQIDHQLPSTSDSRCSCRQSNPSRRAHGPPSHRNPPRRILPCRD